MHSVLFRLCERARARAHLHRAASLLLELEPQRLDLCAKVTTLQPATNMMLAAGSPLWLVFVAAAAINPTVEPVVEVVSPSAFVELGEQSCMGVLHIR